MTNEELVNFYSFKSYLKNLQPTYKSKNRMSKVIYEKWENGEKVEPSGWQQIIFTPKGEKKTVTADKIFDNDTPLYPAKQWQGLTDDEINEIDKYTYGSIDFVRAIEQALRNKNGY